MESGVVAAERSGVADRSSDLGWRRVADLDWDHTDRVRSSELESDSVNPHFPIQSQKPRTKAEKKENWMKALVLPIWEVS